jgi:hypothetical protein
MKEKIKAAFETLKKIGRVSGVECVIAGAFLVVSVMLLTDGQIMAALVCYGVACGGAWFAWLHFGEHERAAKVAAMPEVEPFATVAAKPKRRAPAKKPARAKTKAKSKK